MEPWGRIGSGVAELFAAALLLIPGLAWLGALLTMGVLTGAIGAHLTKLGIVVQGDGGLLFALAIIAFAAAGIVAFLRIRQIPILGAYFRN
jgi:putative oxidoreductase